MHETRSDTARTAQPPSPEQLTRWREAYRPVAAAAVAELLTATARRQTSDRPAA